MNSPAEVAQLYLTVGKNKAALSCTRQFLLGVLAGAFIALAGVGSAAAACTVANPSLAKLVSALLFPGGLAMVVLAGSELFTGNCLMVLPLLEGEIGPGALVRNWVTVYLGNLAGSLLVAALCVYSGQLSLFDGALAAAALSTAAAKCALPFSAAFLKGVGCNFLVCTAVWISFAARDAVGKAAGLYFPILLFVVSGFEHSVANMYYISVGLLAKASPAYAAAGAGLDLSALTWGRFFAANLLPVTLGNLVGGCGLGAIYWFCYLRKGKPPSASR
jgi:formate/nitrite transporter